MGKDKTTVKISLILLLILSFYILWPYASAILFAIILAYFTYPVYRWMERRTHKIIAAGNLMILVAVVIIVGIMEGLRVLMRELIKIYEILPEILVGLDSIREVEFMGYRIVDEAVESAMSRVMNYLTGLGASIPHIFFSLLIFFVGYFYFLVHGEKAYEYIKDRLPFCDDNKKRILEKVKLNVDGFIRAEILIAFAQGIVGGIIFYIFGSPYPLFFAILIGILALIPVVGPSLVYWPVGLYEILRQNYVIGIAYIVSGICIISTMDYFLRPRIMGGKAKIHPFVILLGFLGGIYAFGPAGIIIGPILLSLAIILIEEFKAECKVED